MQAIAEDTVVDADTVALESLTRVLVRIAWDSAHAAPPGVTFPQMRLLLMADGLGRVPSSALATALGVNASSVTRLADRLAAAGYLVRGEDPHKRSVVTLEVTDRGRRVVAKVMHRRHAALHAVLTQVPQAHRSAVVAAARTLVSAAAAVPEVGSAGPGPL
ncbi:MAG TPA: MarR family transcriptional regulator [Pseudonocardiaceae bacterium]|nr:MarR family transcriptional regulator [Pseudonocardiaceae bacterium]